MQEIAVPLSLCRAYEKQQLKYLRFLLLRHRAPFHRALQVCQRWMSFELVCFAFLALIHNLKNTDMSVVFHPENPEIYYPFP